MNNSEAGRRKRGNMGLCGGRGGECHVKKRKEPKIRGPLTLSFGFSRQPDGNQPHKASVSTSLGGRVPWVAACRCRCGLSPLSASSFGGNLIRPSSSFLNFFQVAAKINAIGCITVNAMAIMNTVLGFGFADQIATSIHTAATHQTMSFRTTITMRPMRFTRRTTPNPAH